MLYSIGVLLFIALCKVPTGANFENPHGRVAVYDNLGPSRNKWCAVYGAIGSLDKPWAMSSGKMQRDAATRVHFTQHVWGVR